MASPNGRDQQHVRFSVVDTAIPVLTEFSDEEDNTKLTSESTSPDKVGSTALRGNLTREQRNRDPLFYYEVVSVLGVGSMGSVAKVRKRIGVVGGSARKSLQEHFRKTQRLENCFQLPFVGGIFRFCLKGFTEYQDSETSFNDSMRSGGSRGSQGSSILQPRAGYREDYNDHHGEAEYEMVYAMKSIHLSRVTDKVFIDELRNEIEVLKSLDHPHIVKAIETYEHRNQIFIVMELCWGGDLYSRDPYTEDEAARIISSILSAISYMHSKNMIHRDLKYENILFVNTSPRAEVKLIDFGLSAAFGHDELTDGVGTIYTMAPDVLKGKYSQKADLWSVGVLAFMLLSSQMPFYGRKRQHIVEQIMACKYQFKGRRWKRISEQAKDFVADLLQLDPEDRPSAEEALSATWLNRRHAATVRNPHQEEIESAHQSMLNYSKYSKLKKVALMIVAHKSTSEEIGILRKLFQKYDTERNGHLSYAEFRSALSDFGISQKESRELFDSMDLDGTGKIRYTEFLASTIEAQGVIDERRLAEAFDRLDSDDSGYITVENLRGILGEDFPQAEIDAIIKESDITKDGRVSYFEFLAQWQDQKEEKRQEDFAGLARLQKTLTGGDIPLEVSATQDESVDFGSDEEEDGKELVGRVNFIEGKQLSERRASAAATMKATTTVKYEDDHCI